jgi:hypothetical protein
MVPAPTFFEPNDIPKWNTPPRCSIPRNKPNTTSMGKRTQSKEKESTQDFAVVTRLL